jgi:hypothetical protein
MPTFWEKLLWAEHVLMLSTKWQKKNKCQDLRNTSASVKHGGGNVMAWACMAARGPMDLVFIDVRTEDRPHRSSIDPYRYAISFTDDYSGLSFQSFVYFLKHKKDAAKAFEGFLADTAPYGIR